MQVKKRKEKKKTLQYKNHVSSHLLLMHINDFYKIHVWKS